MDWIEKRQALLSMVKKYRWAVLVLICGLVMMAVPAPEDKTGNTDPKQIIQGKEENDLEIRLEELLSRLEGAGKVKVLLSIATGPQTYYKTDEDQEDRIDSTDIRSETVIITSSDRSQQGLVLRKDPPSYLGAVVICQGADRASIRLAVVEAVGTATGLSSDKISVLKMK